MDSYAICSICKGEYHTIGVPMLAPMTNHLGRFLVQVCSACLSKAAGPLPIVRIEASKAKPKASKKRKKAA